jgi:lysozyme
MNVSQNALDVIKEFEGLRLKAYRDPVNIPTIGYGTIRYPDGQKVALGDTISEAEAEAFLKFECDELADGLSSATRGIPLNQNHFDALVSFCYNLGLGAFLGSTLLAKLKASDFAGAAAEFPRWNKATLDGVKVELPGLTKRRAKERALFADTGAGGVPTGTEISNQEKVTSAKGFKADNVNVIVAFDEAEKVIEILELENSLPDTFLAAIRLYPNLRSFGFAQDGEKVPPGNRQKFSGLARPITEVIGAPKLNRQLLVFGVEDMEDGDDDVRQLQTRLGELRYYEGKLDGIFGRLTDRAVRNFQADYFGRCEADGRVGPRTWAKLWGQGTRPTKPDEGVSAPGKNYLKLTKTDNKDQFGLVKLVLSYFRDGRFVDSIDVCSGQSRKQVFRTGIESQAGSMEPLPEGKWFIQNIEWADGRDNYSGAVWNNGLGPAKIRLDYLEPKRTGRSAIEIHIDWNRAGAAGTAGCIGIHNVPDFRKLVGFLRDTDPRSLFVDWELGTCPKP